MSAFFHALSRHWSSQSPIAAISGPDTNSLSYPRLRGLLGRSQVGLRGLGISRESRIGLVVKDGPLAASALLAVAGSAICAPLNPAFGAKDLAYHAQNIGIDLLLCDKHTLKRVKPVAQQLGLPCLEMISAPDCEADFRVAEFGDTAEVEFEFPEPEAIALLLHTSGTTSCPKLVPLSWQNLSVSTANTVAAFELRAQDVCLNVMPQFHIHSIVSCVLASLHAGGSVFCVTSFNGVSFHEKWLKSSAATWYSAVPTVHQAILQAAAESEPTPHSLRFIRSSSASLPPSRFAELTRLFRVPVVEVYGMTEAAGQVASNPLKVEHTKTGSVGLPAGPDISIMSESSNEMLPQGEVGEVVIRGVNVTPGYLDNPEANAAGFVDGWLRTGDQGFQDADGYLFLTGRLKEIINRGGEKILPREIDEAALALTGVAEAVAFARPHASLGEDIALAVILESGSELTPADIREALFESLSAFKIPSEVFVVDTIPKGPAGKLQRIGLADHMENQYARLFEAPRNELERVVMSCLLAVLPDLTQSRIGIHDNFFTLGGDSLSGVRAMAALSEIFDCELKGSKLFHNPTAEQLSNCIAQSMRADGADESMLQALCSHNPDEFEQFLSADG